MQGQLIKKTNQDDFLLLDKLIPKTHLLRKINNHVDFSFVAKLAEPCYSPNNGRPSISPELYFRMILIGYLYSIKSTRKLVEHIHYNISYRWFCGLTLNDLVPHHASLSRIKKRYKVVIFERFFESILKQCQSAGLINSQSVMTDSTLFQANASLNSMKPMSKDISVNKKPSKEGISQDKWHISNKTHRSRTDPDATLAFKAGALRGLKYKAHVCCDTDSRVITSIIITTGSVHDSQPYLMQLKHLKNKYFFNETIADRAYGSGDIIGSLSEVGIRTFIPLFTTRSGKITDAEAHGLTYNPKINSYQCSAKVELKGSKVNSLGYITYRTRAKDCRECPIKASCKVPQMKNREIRGIARHVHADLFRKINTQMETEEFKQKLRERLWKIEGVMNELKNYHCLSKAQFRGIDNTQIQAYMAATAINIKRLIILLLALRRCLVLAKNVPCFTTGRYLLYPKHRLIK